MTTLKIKSIRTTVQYLLKKEISIDVYDDYDERCGIAFDGACALTEKGKKKFESIMNNEVIIYPDDCAVVHCETSKEAQLVKHLFHGYAGFISSEEWDELFREPEWYEIDGALRV